MSDCKNENITNPINNSTSLNAHVINPSKERLLIIDEDAENRDALASGLQELGYSTFETDRAREGLRILQGVPIDLVLIAILTSDMVLSEFTECVQLITPKAAVIFTSNSTSNWMDNYPSQRLIPVLKSRDLLKLTQEIQKKMDAKRRDKLFKNPFRRDTYLIHE